MSILGEIVNGAMRLSDTGKIVDDCWRKIPDHFPNARVDIYQIMPNHVHGIVEIRESPPAQPVGVEHLQPLQERQDGPLHPKQHQFQHVIPKSLGSIIRSFKAAVTREIRGQMKQDWVTIWQRNYYDHIIRSDIEHFFIERYVSLNPFLWHLDSDNPHVHASPIDNLKGTLKEAHGLDESAITYLVDCEMNYRNWQELDMKKQEIRNDIGTIK